VRLVPHAGDLHAAGAVRAAAELNQPPFALIETFHAGSLPPQRSFADDGGGDVVLTVVKRAEDGGALVVRAYETAGRPGPARLRLLDRAIDADFGAHEIKTFLVPDDPAEAVAEVNLLEW
jgi:alpha-mannosidase